MNTDSQRDQLEDHQENYSNEDYAYVLANSSPEIGAKQPRVPIPVKGVLHLWASFFKTLCIFSKNKATLDKVSYGPGQKYSKELKNHSFTSVETTVVKLQ